MILKTILSNFHSNWHEHLNNGTVSTLSPSLRLKSGLVKLNSVTDLIVKSDSSSFLSIYKSKRTRRLSRRPKNKLLYNNLRIKLVKAKLATYSKRYMLLRSNLYNRNNINNLYNIDKFKSKTLYRSSTRLTAPIKKSRFTIRKKKLSAFKSKHRKLIFKRRLKRGRLLFTDESLFKLKVYGRPNKNSIKQKHITLIKYNLKLNSLYLAQNSKRFSASATKLVNTNKVNKPKPIFNLTKISLKSLSNLNKTILNYTSLFIKFRLLTTNFKFDSKKFLIKKSLFSFLKPNESKKNIMNRRKKINSSRIYSRIRNSSLHTSLINRARPSFFKKQSKLFYFDTTNTSNLTKSNYFSRTSSELFLPRVKFKPGYQRI